MEHWEKLAVQCEELLQRYQRAKSEGDRIVLMAMAVSKFEQAKALYSLSKSK